VSFVLFIKDSPILLLCYFTLLRKEAKMNARIRWFGVVLLLVLASLGTAGLVSADEGNLAAAGPIFWTPPRVSAELTPGTPYVTEVSLVSRVALQQVRLVAEPFYLAPFVRLEPDGFNTLPAGITQTVRLTVSIPAGNAILTSAALRGSIVAHVGQRTVGNPLPLEFRLARPTVTPTVSPTPRPAPIAWTPAMITPTLASGEVYTTTASFTSAISLTNVTLRFSSPLDRFARVIPNRFDQIDPGATYEVQLVFRGPEGAFVHGVRGSLIVYAQQRPLPDPLIILLLNSNPPPTRTPTPAPINWTPPRLLENLAPGQQLQTTVSFTSSIPLTNVVLTVRGMRTSNSDADSVDLSEAAWETMALEELEAYSLDLPDVDLVEEGSDLPDPSRSSVSAPMIRLSPSRFVQVVPGTVYRVDVTIAVPVRIRPGVYPWLIVPTVGNRTIPHLLPVTIRVGLPSPTP